MGLVMRLAHFNRRIVVGLPIAISLVAIGPLVSFAQFGPMRTQPNGYPTAMSSASSNRDGGVAPAQRESLLGDHRFNWKMPFSRTNAEAQKQPVYQQPPVGRSIPKAALQGQGGAGGQSNRFVTPPSMARVQNQAVRANTAPRMPANARMAAPMPQRVATRPTVQPPMQRAAVAVPVAAPQPAQSTTVAAPKTTAESPVVRLLAQAHESSGSARTESDFSRIIAACEQAQASRPKPAIKHYASDLASWALNRRGQLRAEAGREDEAIRDFDAAVQADPKRWRAIHNRGVLLAQSGQFERAFEDFTNTIQINPQFAKAYSNRAALFVVAGELTPAIQDYSRALELDPDLSVAHRGLGRACHLESKLDAALRHYDEAVQLSPNDAYAIASRADVLTDLGRYAEAASQYERAIAADPESSHAQSGSAWLLATCPDAAIRNSKLAVERAEAAVKLTGSEDPTSLDTLAAAQANDGDFAAATQTVERAVSLATDDEKKAYQQRLALYEQGKAYRHAPLGDVIQTSHQE
jgi:tetratricopeptide (TPR) repeat protein